MGCKWQLCWEMEVAPRALVGDCVVGSACLLVEYHRIVETHSALRGTTRQDATSRLEDAAWLDEHGLSLGMTRLFFLSTWLTWRVTRHDAASEPRHLELSPSDVALTPRHLARRGNTKTGISGTLLGKWWGRWMCTLPSSCFIYGSDSYNILYTRIQDFYQIKIEFLAHIVVWNKSITLYQFMVEIFSIQSYGRHAGAAGFVQCYIRFGWA